MFSTFTARARRAAPAVPLAVLLALTLSSCTPGAIAAVSQATSAPAPAAGLSSEEARFVDLINAERARAGLGALTVHTGATAVARGWAAELARRGSLDHNPDLVRQVEANVTTAWVRIGENVGTGADVDAVHRALMASAQHRNNVLQGAYDFVGVGVVRTGGTLWASMVFVAV